MVFESVGITEFEGGFVEMEEVCKDCHRKRFCYSKYAEQLPDCLNIRAMQENTNSYNLYELKRFKEYFDEMYGKGLEVANWHENGNLEPFDNFYESAIEYVETK